MGELNRKKQFEREESTHEEKEYILSKSSGRCCHCGCTLKIGHNFSRDHYIPLNKGGTNDLSNLYALCKDCNEKKTDFVIHPYDYYNYLNEEYMNNLLDIYKEYIKGVRWQNLRNFTREDVKVFELAMDYNQKKGNKNKFPQLYFKVVMQKLKEDELDIAIEYLKKYNSKYDYTVDDNELRDILKKIMKEGCIYKVHKNNEILALIPIMISSITVNVTPYYVIMIPGFICNYQKDPYIYLLRQCVHYLIKGLSILDDDSIVIWEICRPKKDNFVNEIVWPFVTNAYVLPSSDEELHTLIQTDFTKIVSWVDSSLNLKGEKIPFLDLMQRSNRVLKRKFKLPPLKSETELELKKRKEKQKNRLRKQIDKETDLREYM